jgi:hypothetical protein
MGLSGSRIPASHVSYAALLLVGFAMSALAVAPRADAFVYWADDTNDRIGRANNDGTGADNSFITGAHEPCGVAVDAKHIYWGNGVGAHTIGRANLDGSGVNQNSITGLLFPCGPAVNGTHIYWANGATGSSDPNLGSIGRARLDGTEVARPLFGNQSTFVENPCGTAVGGEFLYWANSSSDPRIGRSTIPDPLPVGSFVPDAGTFSACWPSVTASHLYWSVFNFGIARVPLDDPTAELTEVTNASATGGTAIHASRIYWANRQEGTVSRANLDGSSPDLAFIRGAGQARGIAVDSGGPGPGGEGCNALTLGKARKNKKKGTAKLSAEVACAGALELSGKGLKPAEKLASGAGEAKLPIKAKGKKKRKLKKKGKAKVEAEVTFTPTSGAPSSADKKVKLVKK